MSDDDSQTSRWGEFHSAPVSAPWTELRARTATTKPWRQVTQFQTREPIKSSAGWTEGCLDAETGPQICPDGFVVPRFPTIYTPKKMLSNGLKVTSCRSAFYPKLIYSDVTPSPSLILSVQSFSVMHHFGFSLTASVFTTAHLLNQQRRLE